MPNPRPLTGPFLDDAQAKLVPSRASTVAAGISQAPFIPAGRLIDHPTFLDFLAMGNHDMQAIDTRPSARARARAKLAAQHDR
jgi:hypothetical protein